MPSTSAWRAVSDELQVTVFGKAGMITGDAPRVPTTGSLQSVTSLDPVCGRTILATGAPHPPHPISFSICVSRRPGAGGHTTRRRGWTLWFPGTGRRLPRPLEEFRVGDLWDPTLPAPLMSQARQVQAHERFPGLWNRALLIRLHAAPAASDHIAATANCPRLLAFLLLCE